MPLFLLKSQGLIGVGVKLQYFRGVKPRNSAPLLREEWSHVADLSQTVHLVLPETLGAIALGGGELLGIEPVPDIL